MFKKSSAITFNPFSEEKTRFSYLLDQPYGRLMQLLKYFQAMLSRTILPFSVILAMACPAQAQIKPGL
ncbi:MAG: hypothetical protein Q8S75_08075, partial [Nitrospirota bacterium]|nr:hypothetical protein [Nitrospirota bacterium]